MYNVKRYLSICRPNFGTAKLILTVASLGIAKFREDKLWKPI